MTIKIEFSMDSLDEAAFIMTTVQRAAQQVRARMTAQANAGTAATTDGGPATEPVAPVQPAPVVPAPLPPQPEQASGPAVQAAPVAPAGVEGEVKAVLAEAIAKITDAEMMRKAAIPAKRGRGRPRKTESTPVLDVVADATVSADPVATQGSSPAPAVDPVTPATGEPAPAAGPVNLFAAPVPVSQPEPLKADAPAPAKIASAAQGAKIGLKPDQRQALFAQVYSMKPDGPAKAIALVKMFGVTRVPDLHADVLAEFDELAARTLHNTFDPRLGRPE